MISNYKNTNKETIEKVIEEEFNLMRFAERLQELYPERLKVKDENCLRNQFQLYQDMKNKLEETLKQKVDGKEIYENVRQLCVNEISNIKID